MRTTFWMLAIGVAIGGSFFVGRYYGTHVAGKRVASIPSGQSSELIETHRTLLVLVDGPDVFCGGDKVPSEAVEEYVRRTMELNHVGQVAVCGSDSARYGDVVVLVDKLVKRGLATNLNSRSIPSGTRLPLTFIDTFGNGY